MILTINFYNPSDQRSGTYSRLKFDLKRYAAYSYKMSYTNPPKPPPKQNNKKDVQKLGYLNFYKKDHNDNYWFQNIPEESLNSSKKELWIQLVKKSIIDYGSYMVENQIFDKTENDKLAEYIKLASEFIKSN